jgi:hypothetical protein
MLAAQQRPLGIGETVMIIVGVREGKWHYSVLSASVRKSIFFAVRERRENYFARL